MFPLGVSFAPEWREGACVSSHAPVARETKAAVLANRGPCFSGSRLHARQSTQFPFLSACFSHLSPYKKSFSHTGLFLSTSML